ncbi:MAG: hypothetical protein GIX02_09470 [Candidatus Eremiobacteraeota bacterium]|nr:hypothetical protein [Candidatus Eremiobacteraeota bacterium]
MGPRTIAARITRATVVGLVASLAAAGAAYAGAGPNEVSPTAVTAAVTGSTDTPIVVSQSSFTPDDYGNQLWLVCSNQSQQTVDHFQVEGTWTDPVSGIKGQFSRVVPLVLGPGERGVATVNGVPAGPRDGELQISVTRVRFTDLALWTPALPRSSERIAALPPPAPELLPQLVADRALAGWSQSAASLLPDSPLPSPSVDVRTVREAVLAQGTPIQVRLGVPVDSQSARPGEVVPLVVGEDLISNGAGIVAKGSVGFGHVDQVSQAAKWGRSGSLTIAADDVEAVDGTMVDLTGSASIQPVGGPGILARIFGGLFHHGKEAAMSYGTPVIAVCAKQSQVAVVSVAGAP